MEKIKLNSDEYHTLVNAIDDKIYNLTRVINRVNKKIMMCGLIKLIC